jgi:uncharacterized damage-inducible protein DinB
VETKERQFALDQLASSEARLLALVEPLSLAQWRFREMPGRWSIAEIVEHVVLFENFISQAIDNALKGVPEPGKRVVAAEKEPLIMGLGASRRTRFDARESVRPAGHSQDPAELIAELKKFRARTLAFAAGTQAAVHDHFFPHIAFGDLDCYQWLVVLGQHAERHAVQIEQIKTHALFPSNAA